MKLGIIGLPTAGKTTIFNALTRGDAPVGQGGRFDVRTAIINVPDERVGILSAMFNPKKTTYARITFADFAGLQKGMSESGAMSGQLLNQLATMDGFVHVVRAFENELYPHPDDTIDPQRDLEAIDIEFLLNDMGIVERRIERIKESLRKGAAKNKAEANFELGLMERLNTTLTDGEPLRNLDLTDDEEKALRSYGFLTIKPVVVVVNIGDDQAEVTFDYPHQHTVFVNLRGQLEMELAQMSAAGDEEGLAMFMEEYAVEQLSLDTLVRASYDLMGLQSFFTVGEDEVRAWTIRNDSTAVVAAGTIHSDLAKGFIRAETVAYTELVALGGLPQARTAGKLRQEGKTYLVQDGDVINIKFNI